MDFNRNGEQSHPLFRSQRLYAVNGQWYFQTREGTQFGPYIDQPEAKKALAVFIAQNHCDQHTDNSDNIDLQYGAQDGIECMVEELVKFFLYRKSHGVTAALAWANQRRKKLLDNIDDNSNNRELIEVIRYVIDDESK